MSYADQIRVEPSAYKMRSLIADGIEENKAIADNAKEVADNADTNATEAKEQVEINTTEWNEYKQNLDVIEANEAARQENESQRVENEAARQENESQRVENEAARQNAEIERGTNEGTRVENENNRILGYQTMISTSQMILKSPVDTYDDIATAYPTPQKFWTVRTLDTGKLYRYDGAEWIWIDTLNSTVYDALVFQLDTALRQQMFPNVIDLNGLTIGDFILPRNPVLLGNVTLA
jgi:hypothetical protein